MALENASSFRHDDKNHTHLWDGGQDFCSPQFLYGKQPRILSIASVAVLILFNMKFQS